MYLELAGVVMIVWALCMSTYWVIRIVKKR